MVRSYARTMTLEGVAGGGRQTRIGVRPCKAIIELRLAYQCGSSYMS